MFKLTVGNTYKVRIESEMSVYFTSPLKRITVWREWATGSEPEYEDILEAEYEDDFHVDRLEFENGVVVENGGCMEFEYVPNP